MNSISETPWEVQSTASVQANSTDCSSNLFMEQESGTKIPGFWTASLGSAVTTSLSVCRSLSQLSCLECMAYGCIFAFWKLQKLLLGED
jgi:hypothetical protein